LGRRQPDGAHRLPEIAQDRISSVRVKFDPYQDCFNSSGASQSEDRNDKQKTGFFDSIGSMLSKKGLRDGLNDDSYLSNEGRMIRR
jgi:hypothetical protein